MTDSGGIQEEAISIGKPVLILRRNTERIEGVKLGSAILTGTSTEKIYYFASLLLKNKLLYNQMSKLHKNVYGSGNSSKIIVNIIERYFEKKLPKTYSNITNSKNLDELNYNKFFFNYDDLLKSDNNIQYDVVIVLTVWKRNNLDSHLMQIKRQSIVKNKKINIIIFQNYTHKYK